MRFVAFFRRKPITRPSQINQFKPEVFILEDRTHPGEVTGISSLAILGQGGVILDQWGLLERDLKQASTVSPIRDSSPADPVNLVTTQLFLFHDMGRTTELSNASVAQGTQSPISLTPGNGDSDFIKLLGNSLDLSLLPSDSEVMNTPHNDAQISSNSLAQAVSINPEINFNGDEQNISSASSGTSTFTSGGNTGGDGNAPLSTFGSSSSPAAFGSSSTPSSASSFGGATYGATSANNHAPVAIDDTFTTNAGQTLSVTASGLLQNDSDPDGDAISPIRLSNPSFGNITSFGSDGSFTYVPNSHFSGRDSFTYQVTDGQLNSNVATVTINVTATTTLSVAATSPNASEAGSLGVFTITRSGDLSADLDVGYAMSGTATMGHDYHNLAPSVTIPAGQASVQVIVDPLDDNYTEGNESVILTLNPNAAAYQLGSSSATSTIIDDVTDTDSVVSVTVNNTAIAEDGGVGATFTFTRTGDVSQALSVPINVGGTSISGLDYTSLPATANFAAGSATTTLTLMPVADNWAETNENVVVNLAQSNGLYEVQAQQQPLTVAFTQETSDIAPVLSVTSNPARINEAGGQQVAFTITRSGSTSQAITANYTAAYHSASAQQNLVLPSVYDPISIDLLPGSVSFAAGQSSTTIYVTPTNDSVAHEDVLLQIQLNSSSSYRIDQGTGSVDIGDDDIQISATPDRSNGVIGSGDHANFVITRIGDNTKDVVINYTVGGTAVPGVEYVPLSGVFTLPAGASKGWLTVMATDQAVAGHTVTITGASGTGYYWTGTTSTGGTGGGTQGGFTASGGGTTEGGGGGSTGGSGSGQITFAAATSGPGGGATSTLPVVSVVAQGDKIAYESGPTSPQSLRFSRTGSTASQMPVTFELITGLHPQATLNTDYFINASIYSVTPVSGYANRFQANIPYGSSYIDVPLFPYVDSIVEGDEPVKANIISDSSYTIDQTKKSDTVIIRERTAYSIASIVTTDADPQSGADLLQAGNASATVPLNLGDGPGPSVTSLKYNSDWSGGKPFLQVKVRRTTTDTLPVPAKVKVVVTWDGDSNTQQTVTETIPSNFAWGVPLLVGLTKANWNFPTGRHTYSMSVDLLNSSNTSIYSSSSDGATFIYNDTVDLIGDGWSYGFVNQLISIAAQNGQPAGKLMVFGNGGTRFYAQSGSTYQSPLGDPGALTLESGNYVYRDPTGTKLTFNSSGNQTAWTSPDGNQQVTFTYVSGRLNNIKWSDGTATKFNYTPTTPNRLSSIDVTPAGGSKVSYGLSYYPSSGNYRLKTVSNPDGGYWTFNYQSGRLAEQITSGQPTSTTGTAYLSAEGTLYSLWNYDSNGLVSGFQQGRNSNNTYAVTPLASLGFSTPFQGEPQVTVTDPANHTTTYQLDAYADGFNSGIKGIVTNEQRADGSNWSWVFDPTTLAVTSSTDGMGVQTTYDNDSKGSPTTIYHPAQYMSVPAGYVQLVERIEYVDINNRHLPSKVTDQTLFSPNFGNGYSVVRQMVTAYTYSSVDGNLATKTVDVNGMAYQWSYYWSNGDIVGIMNPDGSRMKLTYDGNHRLLSMTQGLDQYGNAVDPTQNITSTWYYGYDTSGNVKTVTDPKSVATTFDYDLMHRLIRTNLPSPSGSYTSTQAKPMEETEYYPSGLVKATRSPVRLGNDTSVVQQLYVYNNDTTGESGRGLPTKIIDQNRSFTLSGGLYQWSNTPADIRQTTATYNGMGKPATVTDPLGNTTSLAYSATGQLGVINYPNNLGIAGQAFDANGRVIQSYVTDTSYQHMQLTSYSYDYLGRVSQVSDGLPGSQDTLTTSYAYDDINLKTFVTDPNNHYSTIATDNLGRNTKSWNSLNYQDSSVGYGYLGMPTGGAGWDTKLAVNVNYDILARNKSLIQYKSDGSNSAYRAVYSNTFDLLGNVLSTSRQPSSYSSNVNEVDYAYDNWSRPVSTMTAAGSAIAQTSTAQYDYHSNPTLTVDPTLATGQLGRTTRYDYGTLDRLTKVTYLPGTTLESATNYTAYDANDHLLSVQDVLGRTTSFTYDPLGRTTSQTDPDPDGTGPLPSPQQFYTYDASGAIQSVTDQLNRQTLYSYDTHGRLASTTDAAQSSTLAQTTAYTYDKNSNVETVTPMSGSTVIGPVTKYVYDLANRPYQVTEGFGSIGARTTTYGYNNTTGLLQTVTAPNSAVTTYGYDALDRQNQTTNALGAVTNVTYDNLDRVTSIQDPDLNSTNYFYDDLGRLSFESVTAPNQPALGTRSYVYDAGNRLTSYTDRTGKQTQYTYDDLDRLQTEQWNTPTSYNVYTATYGYSDKSNNVASITDPNSSLSFVYDNLDRVTQTTESYTGLSQPQREQITYDAAGRTQRVDQGPVVNSTFQPHTATINSYDDLDRPTSVRQQTSSRWMQADYAYNSLDQVTSRTVNSGLTGQSGGTPIVASYSYSDPLKRLTSINYTQGSASLASFSQTYKPNTDWIQTETSSDGTSTYGYDAIGQLTDVSYSDTSRPAEHYAYDPNGNRTGNGYVVGAYNRMLASPGYTYTYDAENNRSTRTDTATSGIGYYQWDNHNRLTQVSGSISGTQSYYNTYQYDALDNKIGNRSTVTTWNYPDPLIQTVTQTWFGLDGDQVSYSMDSTGAVTTRQFHGAGLDEVLAEDRGSGPRWSLTDSQGSVRKIVDGNGVSLSNGKYNGFGKAVQTADSFFSYTGLETEALSGLQYNRGRWYDANAGRFISQDPIGFAGGSANLSSYVDNNPVNYSDPFGMFKTLPGDTLPIPVPPPGQPPTPPSTGGGSPGTGSPPVGKPGRPISVDDGGATLPVVPIRGGGSVNADGNGVPSGDQAAILEGIERYLGYLERLRAQGLLNAGQFSLLVALQNEARNYRGLARRDIIDSRPAGRSVAGQFFHDVWSGPSAIKIGLKAYVNQGWKTIVSFFTLGNKEAGDVIDVTEEDRQYGYNGSALMARIGFEFLSGLGLGQAAKLGKAGTWLGRASQGAFLWDMAGNANGAGRGAYGLYQNGWNWGDGIQLAGGLFGLAGNMTRFLPNCFVAGTPVSTEDGLRPIEFIKKDDRVLSFNFEKQSWEFRRVLETFAEEENNKLVKVFTSYEMIESTAGHPFWVIEGEYLEDRPCPEHHPASEFCNTRVPGRWVSAEDLCVGDVLFRKDLPPVRVNNLESRDEKCFVYNFHVEGLNNYVVGTSLILVHNNSKDARELAKNLTAAGDPRPLLPLIAQAAHVVPTGWFLLRPALVRKAIQAAKDALASAGIPINSASNGFWATIGHFGTHTNSFLLDLGNRLKRAMQSGTVKETLEQIRQDILNGVYIKK